MVICHHWNFESYVQSQTQAASEVCHAVLAWCDCFISNGM